MVAEEPAEEVADFSVKTASGGITFLLGTVGKSVVLIVLLILLARLLQKDLFGFYTLVIAFYSLMETTGYLGIGTTIKKKLSDASDIESKLSFINGAFLVTESVAVLMMLLAFLLAGYFANTLYHNPSLVLPIEIAGITVLVSAAYNIWSAALLGLRRSVEAALSIIAFAVGYMVFAPLLVYLGYGVLGAIIGLFVGYAIGAVVSLFYLSRFIKLRFTKPQKGTVKTLLKFSLPIFVSNIGVTATNSIGVLLLGIYTTAIIVGNYGVAFKFGSFADVIILASISVLIPTFTHVIADKKLKGKISDMYNKSIYFTLLFLLPLLAYAISVAIPLIALLFSYSYKAAPYYLMIVAAGITAGIIGKYAGSLVISYGNVKKFMKYQLIVIISEIILMFIMIPLFNIVGLLAVLYVIGPILLDVIYIKALSQQFSIKLKLGKVARVSLASLIIFVLLVAISTLMHQSRFLLLINGVLLLVFYPPLLAMAGGISMEDVEFIKKVGNRMPMIKYVMVYLMDYTQKFIRAV